VINVPKTRRQDPYAPVADFGLSPAHPSTADEIRLYDFSYDPGGIGISSRGWDFGDGDRSPCASPRHRFHAAGIYQIRLTVTTFDGRVQTAVRVVRVQPC